MKCESFDEKQMFDRGTSFRIGFITSLCMTALNFFVTDVFEISIDKYASFLIMIWVPLTVCSVLLILKDAYSGKDSARGNFFFLIYGAAGLFIILYSLFEIFSRGDSLIKAGVVTSIAGRLAEGICILLTCIIYFAKQFYNSKKYSVDE
jgi:hypothetical protein